MTERKRAWSWLQDLHPGYVLNANDRKHWGAAHPQKLALRQYGDAAWRTMRRERTPLPQFPPHVEIYVDVSYPDCKPHDVLNLYPTMKPFIDGMVSGSNNKGKDGFLRDDNDVYASGPFMRWSGQLSTRSGFFQFRIVFVLTERPYFNPDALAPSIRKKLVLSDV